MGKTRKIEPRTKSFAKLHKELSAKGLMVTHEELARLLGFEGKQSITEIIKQRQNIDEDKWEKFKTHFGIMDISTEYTGLEARQSPIDSKSLDFKEKYYALLEKENAVKDKAIDKLSLAVDNIEVIDKKVERLDFTVNELKDKFEAYEPTLLGLQEFVIGEIADLTKKSYAEVHASLRIKVGEQKKEVRKYRTRKD